jgi:bifunctional non-homologous end joining protein LigD
MYRQLRALERKTTPFVNEPRTNERAHWVRPRVVVEVKFNEWTADGKLRQPIFVGTRDDKDATEVRREPISAGVRKKRRLGLRKPRAAKRARTAAR